MIVFRCVPAVQQDRSSACATPSQVPPCHGAELPSDEYLDCEELEFVSGFDALMDAAHYSRLSRQEWETAAQEEFTVGSLSAGPGI